MALLKATTAAPRSLVSASRIKLARSLASAAPISRDHSLDDEPVFKPKLPAKAIQPSTHITSLSNGVKIATYENYGPTSNVAIVLRAGPRYEDSHSAGASHFLKHFSFQSTSHRSHVRLSREVELLGGNMTTTVTREHIIYNAEFLRGDLPAFLDLLADIVTSTRFKDWEVHELAGIVEADAEASLGNPKVAILEGLHRTAFHNTLGNSLFASPSSIHHMNPEILQGYLCKRTAGSTLAIVGAGVNHDDLTRLANNHFSKIAADGPSGEAAKYYGGDLRLENFHDPLNRYVVAFEGTSTSSPDFIPFQVLSKLLDGSIHVKWGSGASIFAQTSSSLGFPASISAFNISYSDAGLFGIYTEAKASDIPKAVNTAITNFKKVASGVKDEDVQRAKAQTKFSLAYETKSNIIDDISRQVSGNYRSPAELAAAVDKVSADDLVRVANTALKSPVTAVAYGDIIHAPYSQQLQL